CILLRFFYSPPATSFIASLSLLDALPISGAVMSHFYEAQFDDQPPQLDALTEETDLVTVGIAGNDFGFADLLIDCAKRSITNPVGSPCADHYGDELDERIEDLRDEVSTRSEEHTSELQSR